MGRGDETRSGIENVLPTCKAVSYRGDQRIIAVLFGSEKRAHRKKFNIRLKKIILCLFIFFAYRIRPLVLKLQNGRDSHSNLVNS